MKSMVLSSVILGALLLATTAATYSSSEPKTAGPGQAGDQRISSEVVVTEGMPELKALLKSENWWGKVDEEQQLEVPRLIITAIKPSWQEAAATLTVPDKKQFFYRLMLPLVVQANGMVLQFRNTLVQAETELKATEKLSPENLELVQRLAILLPGMEEDDAKKITATTPGLSSMIEELIYRVDIVPPGLALGQAAYESGYGTSRFAVEGNSLFGQWTYKGDGIKPEQQRKHLGDHQIKAFEWPFDSVRGYFINLMTHPAYEDFRAMRAKLRAAGKPLDSLELADSLTRYSERGQKYVNSLKGIIRVNKLDAADHAVFRDEPLRFLVTAQSREEARELEATIQEMRASGELQEIIEQMRLK